MNWTPHFFSSHEGTAIIDAFGQHSYSTLLRLTSDYIQHFKLFKSERILLSGQNNVYLVATIMALLETGFEVILQDINANPKENESLRQIYKIDKHLVIENENDAIQFKGTIEKYTKQTGKLYFFSSGSTGIPKLFGYSVEHLYKMMCTWTFPLQISNNDTLFCPLPVTHNHGLVISLAALMKGAQMIYSPWNGFDTALTIELLEKNQPTIITGTPYVYQKLLTEIKEDFCGFKNIRYAFCGSAPMNAELSSEYYKKLGKYLNQAYGLSEIGPVCIDLHPEKGVGTVGEIFNGIEYKIINESGNTCNTGEPGELLLKAPYMCKEYLENPEETAITFANGWLHTKDIVIEDELKRIIITGRKSLFINIAGLKVHPSEIENAIHSAFKGINVAVQEQTIQSKQTIVLFLENDASEHLLDIQKFCQENLSSYKRPTKFAIIPKIPLNSLGKVLYPQLPSI